MCFPLPLQPEMVKNLLLSMRALSKKTCLLAVLKPFLTNQGFSSEKFAWKFNTVWQTPQQLSWPTSHGQYMAYYRPAARIERRSSGWEINTCVMPNASILFWVAGTFWSTHKPNFCDREHSVKIYNWPVGAATCLCCRFSVANAITGRRSRGRKRGITSKIAVSMTSKVALHCQCKVDIMPLLQNLPGSCCMDIL